MKQRSRWQRERGQLRLWPILIVLPLSFIAALAGLALLTISAWVWLRRPALPHSKTISLHDWIAVLQLVFASVAGAGALVALIVAYRKQRVTEADSIRERARVFNERFIAIAAQLGETQAAIRLAGVHAMAGLADDWEENRQTCVDVLCAYLRMPYEPTLGVGASTAELLAFKASQEVRHTVIRVIANHLRPSAATSWEGIDLDFTGVQFDGGDFVGVHFSHGIIRFTGASFLGGTVDFGHAVFSGGTVDFSGAKFSGGRVRFSDAKFSGSTVTFDYAQFSGRVLFTGAIFSGGVVRFARATVFGGMVRFGYAQFSGATVDFSRIVLSRGQIRFGNARFTRGMITFASASFSGGSIRLGTAQFAGSTINFNGAEFSLTTFYFGGAQFSRGSVHFSGAKFSGSIVRFIGAHFTGSEVDFSSIADWTHPPVFDFTGSPPPGVKLP